MATLEGSVKTPFGEMPKKTVAFLGVGAAVIVGVVYYRQKKAQASSSTASSTAEIDPATGYPYGSPEDAAALAAQGSYQSPGGGGSSGGGSSSIPPSNISFSSNGQWVQAVIQYMTSNGLVTDASVLSSALGKYIAGQYVKPGSPEDLLIPQAIAAEGYPPVAGPNGYPPSINRTPSAITLSQVTGLKVIRNSNRELALTWSPVAQAHGYEITWTDAQNQVGHATSLDASYVMSNLAPIQYRIQVRAKADSNGTDGPWSATLSVTSKK